MRYRRVSADPACSRVRPSIETAVIGTMSHPPEPSATIARASSWKRQAGCDSAQAVAEATRMGLPDAVTSSATTACGAASGIATTLSASSLAHPSGRVARGSPAHRHGRTAGHTGAALPPHPTTGPAPAAMMSSASVCAATRSRCWASFASGSELNATDTGCSRVTARPSATIVTAMATSNSTSVKPDRRGAYHATLDRTLARRTLAPASPHRVAPGMVRHGATATWTARRFASAGSGVMDHRRT